MQSPTLRILHTSDWHIGRTLYGRHRYAEFAAFFDWLYDTIVEQQVDILLVAGDVFHTTTPSNRAQQLYYTFLCRVAASSCRHLVVTAGNHDSPTFLSAPKELLLALNIHILAALPSSPAEEVLVLKDQAGEPEAIICAVPFLRDRDIRTAVAGQDQDDRERDLIQGIKQHYQEVCAEAEEQRNRLPRPVPLIGMGHLFTAGGDSVEGDGVRNLYVGSLASVSADAFPDSLDYLALGHLHAPQKVGGDKTRRYSGAPLVMGFGEAKKTKSVCLLEFPESGPPTVTPLNVPIFQPIKRIKGNWDHIQAELTTLKLEGQAIWLEIIYQGEELIADLRQRLDEAVADTNLEILRIRNHRIIEQALRPVQTEESLADLRHEEVFSRCLDTHAIPAEQRPSLLAAYQEITLALEQDDLMAE
ncbi:MAG: exonuclease SbcCD subunit D C-terminal domain-containing protein [Candidatus Electrothrix aestuarii]|uniref:Nuclease SbcCD subunit D n=1 Tax=Candidatus Electrothrix aestuarii TaxID=3062594 RepID=A0AAU8LRP1_9BACT|nr:exonuclease SbcCD subunit D C-terminal domain-containing protein [Candidatus Electrothrix aestuarii]